MHYGDLEFSLTLEDKQRVNEFIQIQLRRVNQGKEQIKNFLKKIVISQLEVILSKEETHP